jgi:hypothetical protein
MNSENTAPSQTTAERRIARLVTPAGQPEDGVW